MVEFQYFIKASNKVHVCRIYKCFAYSRQFKFILAEKIVNCKDIFHLIKMLRNFTIIGNKSQKYVFFLKYKTFVEKIHLTFKR